MILNGYTHRDDGLFEKHCVFPQGQSNPRKETILRNAGGRIVMAIRNRRK